MFYKLKCKYAEQTKRTQLIKAAKARANARRSRQAAEEDHFSEPYNYGIDFVTEITGKEINDIYDGRSKLTLTQKETINLIFKGNKHFLLRDKDILEIKDITEEIILDDKWSVDKYQT
jgi:hypothetical protein